MPTYISILRGINVSGQKLIKMEALRTMYEPLGLHNVTTYVQSGNVVFTSNNEKLAELTQTITQHIKTEFGFDVPIIVLTVDGLKQIIEANPFVTDANKDQAFFHVTFLSSKPQITDFSVIEDKKQSGEDLSFTDNAVYVYCPNGYGKTKLTNTFLETKLKVSATTRNWKTTNELLRIGQVIEASKI